TLVQAFQYWAKMFAISVPIFVLMAVYGHYGKQLGANDERRMPSSSITESNRQVQLATPLTAATVNSNGIQAPGLTLDQPAGPRVSYGHEMAAPPVTKKLGPVNITVRETSAGATGVLRVAETDFR